MLHRLLVGAFTFFFLFFFFFTFLFVVGPLGNDKKQEGENDTSIEKKKRRRGK